MAKQPLFRIRPAKEDDVEAMTEVFHHSFNAPFWQHLFPPTPPIRAWLNESWLIGLRNPTDRTFVVEDALEDNRIVGFSRWMIPNEDGNQERKWPDIPPSLLDGPVAEAFFGGMEINRRALMNDRPHWNTTVLELLAVHETHQRRGIGASLIEWGTSQADESGLETYLDGSAYATPYYIRRHGFVGPGRGVGIPDRPESYGSYGYTSMVRPPRAKASMA